MIPFIALVIGLLLVFLEFYLPGWILGILGAFTLLASLILFGVQYQSLVLSILYIGVIIALLICIIKYAMWQIKHASPNRSIYLKSDQEGFTASSYSQATIGKIGIVDSDLKPGGHIIVDGKKHQAISLSGYISKGEQVIVVGGEGESLKVKQYTINKQ